MLLDVTLPKAWERVVRLSFGPRLSEQPSHHVFLEVMGRCPPAPPCLSRPATPRTPVPQESPCCPRLTMLADSQVLGPWISRTVSGVCVYDDNNDI